MQKHGSIYVTALLILALVSIPVPAPAKPPAPNDTKLALVECVLVIVVVGVGTTIVYGIYKMCKKLDKLNGANTNLVAGDGLIAQAQGDSPNISLVSSPTPAGSFNEEFSFSIQPQGLQVQVIAKRAGVPLMTNTAPIVLSTNGGDATAVVDFTALAGVVTNAPGKFFRLAQ